MIVNYFRTSGCVGLDELADRLDDPVGLRALLWM